MASIDKLSVRGIRAFSPNDDEQVISFCFPLTIIVGANGCGKTTIIEALKYAVTGSLPPGNKSGQAFVHDPKSVGSSVVKAAVKLRFTNRAGKRMLVVRSMELIQKKSTMQFKNLDGIISTHDEQGNKQTLSHKCSELDKQIPQLLGVSKSILDSVVFCHQEDSSWPLMEGSVLKKKFDDIFDSTKYVKALDEIKAQKKEYASQTKDLKAELNLLKGHKHASQGFRQELTKCNHDLSDLVDEIREYNEKIKSETENIQQWRVIMSQVDSINADIDEKNSDIDRDEALIDVHRKNLKEDLTKSLSKEDLGSMLSGFCKSMEVDWKKKETVESQMKELERKVHDLCEKKLDLTHDKGLLMGEKNLYEKNLRTRVELMEELANNYGLELTLSQSQTQQTSAGEGGMSTQQSRFSTSSDTTMNDGVSSVFTGGTTGSIIPITSEDLAAFQKSVDQKRIDLKSQLEEHRSLSQNQEDGINSELNDLSAKVKTVENDIKGLQAECVKAKNELKEIGRSRIGRIRKSDIEEAKKNVVKFTKIRDSLTEDDRIKQIPLEIKKNEENISELQIKIEEDKSILRDLRKCAEEQNSIDLLESQISQDKEVVEEIQSENSALFHKYNVKIARNVSEREAADAMDSYLGEVGDKLDAMRNESEESAEELKKIESVVSESTALLNHNKSNLTKLKNQLDELISDGRGVQRINQIFKGARQFELQSIGDSTIESNIEPQDLLDHFTRRIEELSTKSDQPQSIARIMTKLKKLSKQTGANGENFVCPCCTRGFKNRDEGEIFLNQMNLLADIVESPLVQMEAKKTKADAMAKKNYTTWRNTVSASATDWSEHKRISMEIESLQTSVEIDEHKLTSHEKELEEIRDKSTAAKEEHSDLQQLQDIVRRMRDILTDIAGKKSQIMSKKDELSILAPKAEGKNMRTLERQHDSRTEEKDLLQNQISKLNKEAFELNSQIQKVSQQVSKAEKVVRDKEEQFAQEQKANARRNELNNEISKALERENKLQEQMGPIRQKAKAKEMERNRFRENSKKEEYKRSSLLNKFDNDAEKVTSISKAIDSWTKSGKSQRLDALDSEIDSVEAEMKEFNENLKEQEPELNRLRSVVEDRESDKRNVESNLELLKMKESCDRLEDEISLLEEERDKLDIDNIRAKHNDAMKKIKTYESDRSRREGSKDALMAQQREVKRKLQTKEYKDIDERHRVKMIEHETTSMVVSDLDIYYSALDQALLRYHGSKIEGINKIIKELWALTYRGEDITNIRITSDQDSSSKAKKSYNYRVVMTKGTTELDMRGRCSAGQRVLASIVIRLALAETFCINCGVMALDEPTTNLDFANKRGLAVALAQIIVHRASQDNFQLVIITHDEDFVSMMKNELAAHNGFTMPEKYFQVMREEASDGAYYSKIHEIDWDDI